MNKFIACKDGKYFNIEHVVKFQVFSLTVSLITNEERATICDGFKTDEDAQDWLDKFMEKYGLCIEKTTTSSRCF